MTNSKTPAPKIKGFDVYRRLLGYVHSYWPFLLLGIISTMFASGVDASLTWSLKPLLDEGFIAKNKLFIQWLPLFVIVAFLLRAVTNFMSQYFITLVGRNVVMALRKELFNHMLKLPATYFERTTSGQLISTIIFNVEQVNKASSDSLIILVRETCFIAGLLFVMLTVSWKLTVLFFATAPMIGFIARKSSKKMRGFSHYLQNGMGNITHITEEAVEGNRVIKTFGGQNYESAKFLKAIIENRRREMQIIITDSLASPAVQLTVAVVIAITVYLATSSVGQITAGGFASILASMLAILKPLKNITTVNNTIQRGIVGAESIFTLLDDPIEKDTGTQSISRVQGKVTFDQVNFAYSNHKTVLHNINLQVAPGQIIALVGKSGSGKSTLMSLLPRFYDEFTGSIKIDDINIHDFKLANLRSQFALVSQHVVLFNDTIGNNIAYGSFDKVTEKQILEAAEAANAMEFIRHLPEGLNTLIGENGLLLSGGQRQRIAIARAILKNAPILILDEATSALDTESERKIQGALATLMRNRTTFVIAHRLSTIENADKIIVLRDGHIVEMGTHQELLALGREYAKLHTLQFRDMAEEAEIALN